MTKEISKYDDYIYVTDVINIIEADEENAPPELVELLEELKGCGGDEQWRGDWYPQTLIRDSYFKEYAMELAEDIGAIDRDGNWPNYCIDWDMASRDLQMDYSSVEFEGITYWYL